MTDGRAQDGGSAIDFDAIEVRYREERAKRARADGAAQYRAIGIGSELEADPFNPVVTPREAVTSTAEVLLIGGGFSSLITAVELLKDGLNDVLIVEKGADLGGTWYWNRYPGLCCDVEAYIYLPYLEELGYVPTEKYASGAEIREYARRIGQHWNLYEKTLFQTRVTEMRWTDEQDRWLIRTNRGDAIRARHVVLATGGLLHRPKLPGIQGLESFEGKTFHTSRWDYEYTGGDITGGLTKLSDKRVALIGTGATALQVVPHLGADAKELYVFQRTPTAVDIRNNCPTDNEWFASLKPGWQRRRMVNFDGLLAGIPHDEDLVGDQWTQGIWSLPRLQIPADGSPPDMEAYQQAVRANEHLQMERIRARVDELVDDSATAEALKPWFSSHCKRPGFHDGYLQTFNRPNVTLVDTKGRGPDYVTANAIHFDGTAYEVDCIIYATGFESAVSPGRAGGFPIYGRGGVSLEERWEAEFRTLHGIMTAGFPNMYVVGGIRHAAVSINVLFVNAIQAHHVARLVRELKDGGHSTIEISDLAEEYWADKIAENSVYDPAATRMCTPGYYNAEGALEGKGTTAPLWAHAFGGEHLLYEQLLADWRRERIAEQAILDRSMPVTTSNGELKGKQ